MSLNSGARDKRVNIRWLPMLAFRSSMINNTGEGVK